MSVSSISAETDYWLHSDGSLTALLEEKAGQPLIVKRTFEGYLPLSLTQKVQLDFQGSQLNRPVLAWVREVLLYGNSEEPWIAAQSIFPIPSLKGNARRLKHLKGTPIGYVLFKRQSSLPYQRIIDLTDRGWRRSTVYNWYQRPIIISETFLPNFFETFESDDSN